MSEACSSEQVSPVDATSCADIVRRACTDKADYWSRKKAKTAAREASRQSGHTIRDYRCPFEPGHFHIGHPPSLERLRELAAAVRWYRQERFR